MNQNRRQRADDLYRAALQRSPEDRNALLAGAEPEPRREVEARLRARATVVPLDEAATPASGPGDNP